MKGMVKSAAPSLSYVIVRSVMARSALFEQEKNYGKAKIDAALIYHSDTKQGLTTSAYAMM